MIQIGLYLLIETFFDVSHSLEISGNVRSVLRSVKHLVLRGQVIQRVNGRIETGNGQESSQVSGVRGDNDETKEPPGGSD